MMNTVSVVEIIWTAVSVIGIVVCTWAWRSAWRVRDWVDGQMADALMASAAVESRTMRRLVVQSRLAYGWFRDESIRVTIQLIALVIGVTALLVAQGRAAHGGGVIRFEQVATIGMVTIQMLTVAKSALAMRDRRWIVEMMGDGDV